MESTRSVIPSGDSEVGRGYDNYQREGTPLPDAAFALSAAEREGANFRRHDQSDTHVGPGFDTHMEEGRETAGELPTVEVSMLDNCRHSEARGDEGKVKDEPVVEIVTVEPYDGHKYVVEPFGKASPSKLAEAAKLAMVDTDAATRRTNVLALVDSALVVAGELQESIDDDEETICWPPKIGRTRKCEILTRILESVVDLPREDGVRGEVGGGPTRSDEAIRRMREISWEMMMDQSAIATMRDEGGETPGVGIVENNESNLGRPDVWDVFLESCSDIPTDPAPAMLSDLCRPCESSSDSPSNDARTEQDVGMIHDDPEEMLPVVNPKRNHTKEVGCEDDESSDDDAKGSLHYPWRSKKVKVKQWLSDGIYLTRPPYDADDEDDSNPGCNRATWVMVWSGTDDAGPEVVRGKCLLTGGTMCESYIPRWEVLFKGAYRIQGMLTHETMIRGMPAVPMLECVSLTTFRYSTILQECTTHGCAVTEEFRESANMCLDYNVATMTISLDGLLTWGMPGSDVRMQGIPVGQRNICRHRMLSGSRMDPGMQTRRATLGQRGLRKHACSPMCVCMVGWSSKTWAHDEYGHVLGSKTPVDFMDMGRDIEVNTETWKMMVAMETAVAEAPTPHRRPGSRDRDWNTTWAFVVMLATVMCLCLTIYWVYQLVERSLANYRQVVQNQLLN